MDGCQFLYIFNRWGWVSFIGAKVSSLWSSGNAVEVHAEGPVSIPIASKDEDMLHGCTGIFPGS